mmetsp:Transcript_17743/g.44266  ORF Transcript_17743/g.44266 Transcript_17743/m.44266 type:complete len:85 (+) Transcript_17743:1456-1710(+)
MDIATTNAIGPKWRRRMPEKRDRLWCSKAPFDVSSARAGLLMKSDESGSIIAEYCRCALYSEDALVSTKEAEDLNQANNAADDE